MCSHGHWEVPSAYAATWAQPARRTERMLRDRVGTFLSELPQSSESPFKAQRGL